MSVHSSGTGSGWKEDLDADQPHGQDYIEFNDIRIGIRKRLSQEHTTPADTTAGGIHKPGGTACLAMDITNAVGDPTGNVVADGTYRGHGLAWTYVVEAGANKGLLWCATAAAGASTTGDWTLVKLHPDLQWAGGDVTWQGDHAFAKCVSIGDALYVDASADFSGIVNIDDLTTKGYVKVGTDLAVFGDMSVDGTADFGGAVAIIGDLSCDATVVTGAGLQVDGTANFAGTSKILSDYTNEDSGSAAFARNEVYLANTDGYFTYICQIDSDEKAKLYVGDTTDPAGAGVKVDQITVAGNADDVAVSGLVPKGDYFAISTSAAPNSQSGTWISFGNQASPTKE